MTDRITVVAVVVFLGAFALLGLASTTWLIDHSRDASNIAIVAGLTGTSLGALATLLASTKSTPTPADPPAPVVITNEPDDPVQVEQAPKK